MNYNSHPPICQTWVWLFLGKLSNVRALFAAGTGSLSTPNAEENAVAARRGGRGKRSRWLTSAFGTDTTLGGTRKMCCSMPGIAQFCIRAPGIGGRKQRPVLWNMKFGKKMYTNISPWSKVKRKRGEAVY